MAGVVETSWSLGDIDLAGAMEVHMPRGDYWAGLYNAKSTLHVRPQAALAFLRTVVRGLVKVYGSGLLPRDGLGRSVRRTRKNEGIWAFPCAGTRNNAGMRKLPSGHFRARRVEKMHGSGHPHLETFKSENVVA